jgi:beta-propeller repeat-containing protein
MGKLRRPLALASASVALALAPLQAGERGPSGARVPVLWAANDGQCAPAVRFQARTPGLVASVVPDGLLLDLDGAVLRLRFLGADPEARVEGSEPRAARVHYLSGACTVRDGATFGRVRVLGLYPGIDLELYDREGVLEYDLVLAPGADATRLALALEGAESLVVDEDGALVATCAGRSLRQRAPLAWQVGPDGVRAPLACEWRRLESGAHGFALGALDPAARVVIDPVLTYGTHVGGSNADQATALVVDEQGNVYVTGWARSVDFPRMPEGRGSAARGKEAVVFKLGPDGRELVWSTTLGGRGDDAGMAIALTPAGEVVVAGTTESDDFPTTDNAFDEESSGSADGFVVKLALDGSQVLFSTFLGGSAEDVLTGLALTEGGQVTLAGTTRSRDFPVSSSSYGVEPRGRDAFVTRLDPDGERMVFSARIGGTDDDEGRAVAVDADGATYLTGRTVSHDFPTTLGALDRERSSVDAFVLKLSAGGRTLLYSTFLGGNGQDEATAIAVDGERRVVVAGWTQSLDFPFDADKHAPGRKDGFAVRLSETGNALLWAAPLGGGSADEALGVTLDPLGTAWVVGRTRSGDLATTRDAHQPRLAGAADAFLVGLSTTDGKTVYATFLGGEGDDELCAVHAEPSGSSLAVGGSSSGIPLEQRGALAGKKRGPSDAFVLRFDPRLSTPITPARPTQAGLGFGF